MLVNSPVSLRLGGILNLETGNPFKENTEQNFLDSRTYLLFQTFLESLRQTVITEKK